MPVDQAIESQTPPQHSEAPSHKHEAQARKWAGLKAAHPRRVLEHFAKKDSFVKVQEKVREDGKTVASAALMSVIGLLPVLINAKFADVDPHITMGVQNLTLTAAGIVGADKLGKSVEKATGKPRSKLQRATHAAMGVGAMVGIGHGMHEFAGDMGRGITGGADDPAVIIGSSVVGKGIEKAAQLRQDKKIEKTAKVSAGA